MQFGMCGAPEEAAWMKAAGADYVEGNVQNFLKPATAQWQPPIARAALALPMPSYNYFLPADLKVTGPNVDLARLAAYATRACSRAREMGSSIIVFGSAGARNAPAGWSREKADEQLVEAMRVVGPIAREAGITIAMEPTNRGESNMLNTTEEALKFLGWADAPGLAMVLDIYHFLIEKEPLDAIDRLKGAVVHAHVADPARRAPPGPTFTALRPCLARLKAIGYDGRMSIECTWKDAKTELAPALDFLRKEWAAA
jgi:sugar phosphate isomerase/epimerase